MTSRLMVFLGALGISGIVTGNAISSDPSGSITESRTLVRHTIKAGSTLETAKEDGRALLVRTDVDGGGVAESDYVLLASISAANHRAQLMMQWLKKDLDGDGNVTVAEIEAAATLRARSSIKSDGVTLSPTEQQIKQKLDKFVAHDLSADTNKDGSVSFAEARAKADALVTVRNERTNRAIPLSLDKDGNGAVLEDELLEAIEQLFHEADGDGNGVVSKAEAKAINSQSITAARVAAEREAVRELASCRLEVPTDAKIIAYGTYTGGVISKRSIKGNPGHALKETAVHVPASEGSVSLVLTAYDPVLWVIDPDSLSRIRSVLVMGHHSQAIANLPPSIPLLMSSQVDQKTSPCRFARYAYKGGKSLEALNRHVEQVTGRQIDRFTGNYKTAAFPLGVSTPHPAIAGQVQSLAELGRAAIPPGRQGIEHLVQQGKLRRATESDVARWLDAATEHSSTGHLAPVPRSEVEHHNIFVALQNLTLPPGLHGAGSIALIVPEDVSRIVDPGSHNLYFDIASGKKCRGLCPKVVRSE